MNVELLKRFENIVTKGEIAHFEQFSLLSQYFLKTSDAEASEITFVCGKGLIFYQIA